MIAWQSQFILQWSHHNAIQECDCVGQCFSTFSVKQNPLQKFWLLKEPMSFGGTLKARKSRPKAESGGGVVVKGASFLSAWVSGGCSRHYTLCKFTYFIYMTQRGGSWQVGKFIICIWSAVISRDLEMVCGDLQYSGRLISESKLAVMSVCHIIRVLTNPHIVSIANRNRPTVLTPSCWLVA